MTEAEKIREGAESIAQTAIATQQHPQWIARGVLQMCIRPWESVYLMETMLLHIYYRRYEFPFYMTRQDCILG
jgi:hypothetical protein